MKSIPIQQAITKKLLLNILIFFFSFQQLHSQDSIQYRIILLGNAGEITREQKGILDNAIQNSISKKTIALFLGNNIYPKGMELGDKKSAQVSQDILRSQYTGFRNKGVPVYFIPGISDWDNNGTKGYEKIIRVNDFINSKNDSLLQVIPDNACPGPFELALNDNLVLVAMDTEWWLYPFNKHMEETDCECQTKRDVLGKLNDIIDRNRDKLIIFATNHPFKSYGRYGGYYPLTQHLFPFANAKNNLYVPLPVVGSIYPLFRTTFPPVTDLSNRIYEDMNKDISGILKTHPNIIHVAAHEQSLQLIQGDVLEVISGAVSKITPVKKGNGSKYAESIHGYVIADVLKDNTVRLTFNKYSSQNFQTAFIYEKTFRKPLAISEEANVKAGIGDSIKMRLNKDYDKVSGVHRSLFGENYRKVWAMETTFPVLKLSSTDLRPKELGGGMQTHSLRLADDQKREWVFRTIEKFPGSLVPDILNNTFVYGVLKDNVTATFPFAPLTVPVFANSLGVPHSNPKIVYVAADKKLGIYSKDFANTLCLLEEREPLGKSISTIKMIAELKKDNDNSVDQKSFLTARILDIFLADWDRHGDQWRWIDLEKGKGKTFKGVPRDRDQVFYVNQGFFTKLLALPWVLPKFQGFGERIKNINALSFNARFIDGVFTNQLSSDDWSLTTSTVVNTLTDSVIKAALKKLPDNVYEATQVKFSTQLQKRRQDLLRAVPLYYRFLNKVIDITASDKSEFVSIKDTSVGKLKISLHKISKRNEVGKEVYSRVLEPSVTKEVRLFLHSGADSIVINNNSSSIKVRIVGSDTSTKKYTINGKAKHLRKVHIYEGKNNAIFSGSGTSIHRHLSDDVVNTSMQTTNRYNKTIPLINAGYNIDDGFMFGGGIKLIRQGFRKEPYASTQQFTLAHSFSTSAFRFNYNGEWLKALGKEDVLLKVKAFAPTNTQNFFGRGNGSVIDKTGNYKRYYRTRFSLYQVDPAIRWHTGKSNNLTIGPSVQYYHYDKKGNSGRFITNVSKTGSYDSSTILNDKIHAGIITSFTHDNRNNVLLPSYGSYINASIQGYNGLNSYSKSFAQLIAELSVYKSIGRKSAIVIANRVGGGLTAGKAAFYQSLFLGGQDNLRGFHQYRFAGEHMLYNNLEARIKLADVASSVLPGQLGLIGFYDVGRVWQKGINNDNTWHQGIGGGLYFAPANIVVFHLVLGNSSEGLYPYFTMGFRF